METKPAEIPPTEDRGSAAPDLWDRLDSKLGPAARVVFWLLLFHVISAAYSPSMRAPFLYDDIPSIVDNADFRHPGEPWRLLSNHPNSMRFDHRPLAGALTMLNFQIAGLNVAHYRIVNVTIHWLVAVLLGESILLYGRRFGIRSGVRLFGLAIALMWALHPLNTAATILITQRMESLMTLFYLVTLYCIMRAVPGDTGGGRWLAGAGFGFAACLASKEVGLSLIVAAPLLDRLVNFESFRDLLRARWRFYAILLGLWVAFVVWWTTGVRIRELQGNVLANPVEYFKTQCRAIANYIRLVFFPDRLLLVYAPKRMDSLHMWLPHGFAILCGLIASVSLSRRWPWLLFPSLLFFIVLAPTSSFLPIPQETEAEWRMYLPSACLLIVALASIRAVGRRIEIGGGGILVLVVALSSALFIGTHSRSKVYRSSESVWLDVVKKEPYNFKGLSNLASVYLATGNERGLRMCAATLYRLGRDYGDYYSGSVSEQLLGRFAMQGGDSAAAELHFRSALEIYAEGEKLHSDLGRSLVRQGKAMPAIEALEKDLANFPEDLYTLIPYSEALLLAGREREAQLQLDRCRRIAPQSPVLLDLLGRIKAGKLGAEAQDEENIRDEIGGAPVRPAEEASP